MTSRRDFLVGGLCAAAAGTAWARTPRQRTSLLAGRELEALLPKQFADWHEVPSDALVVPQSEDSLASKLYSQSLGRIYQATDGKAVMMLIAYGDTQSDQLQLHRPEVCYPAFGFNIVNSAAASIALSPEVTVPGRTLSAESPARTEHISYWTRVGEYLPQSGRDQAIAKLKIALEGQIPDGVLVRISSLEPEAAAGYALNERFAAAMLSAFDPAGRPALIGSERAKALSV